MAVVWQFVFNTDNGLLNTMLGWVGIGPIPWLIDPKWAMVSLCMVSVWKSVPFATVVLLAAMQGVPQTLYEAAQVDGASGAAAVLLHHRAADSRSARRLWWSISIINAFQAFDQVYVLTGGHGGPETGTYVLGIMLFQHAFAFLDFGYASALAWVMFAILLGSDGAAAVARAQEHCGVVMSRLAQRVDQTQHRPRVAVYAALIAIAWCALFPILWALSGSLKTESEVAAPTPVAVASAMVQLQRGLHADAVLADARSTPCCTPDASRPARCSSARWPDMPSPGCDSGAATRCSCCT